jgi:hypothetical protein
MQEKGHMYWFFVLIKSHSFTWTTMLYCEHVTVTWTETETSICARRVCTLQLWNKGDWNFHSILRANYKLSSLKLCNRAFLVDIFCCLYKCNRTTCQYSNDRRKHTYIHNAYIYIIHTYMHSFIHSYIHTCIHTYVHTYIRTYVHTCVHTYARTHIHTYVRTYVHAYIHAYMRTYIHTYIHNMLSLR